MPPVSLPYLQVFRSRGRVYAYYRRDGRQVRIAALLDDRGFAAAYEAARLRWETAPVRGSPVALPGTIAALVAAYRAAPEFRGLAPRTQRQYGTTLDMLVARFGPGLVRQADRAWVLRLRDEIQDTPRSANLRVAVISLLFSFAVDRGMRADNPALRPGRLLTGPGYRPWTAEELTAMTGEKASDVALPVMIARYTAQREGDVLRLPWNAYDGASLTLRQSKTGASLVLPVPAELRRALDAIHPRPSLLICLTAQGRPWKADWFRHRFAQVRAAAGLPADLHFHGLRATRCVELAEHGASDAEIQATSGHKTRSMVAHYTRAAGQKRLAAAGVARLPKRDENG